MHLQDDVKYFYLLTEKEQFHDIKQYWHKAKEHDYKFFHELATMLESSARSPEEIRNEAIRNHRQLSIHDSIFIHKDTENNVNTVTLFRNDFDAFSHYCSTKHLLYDLRVRHEDDILTFEIWKEFPNVYSK